MSVHHHNITLLDSLHTDSDMSGMSYSGSGTNQEIDDQGSALPGYVPYLSLVFRLITAPVILLLSGWVVYTIKTTRSLHKSHLLISSTMHL